MHKNQIYQIFVSSTFRDLEEERRLISEQIFNMGHIPIGMEAFEASNLDQWSYIKRRIKNSDYYVLIVGNRYGSTDSDGISFTRKEYEFAIEEGVPVLSFLSKNVDRDSCDNPEKLDEFRNLCQTKMVRYWEKSDQLALDVLTSLSKTFSEIPREGLVRASEAQDPEILRKIIQIKDENEALKSKLAELDQHRVPPALLEDINKTPLKQAAQFPISSSSMMVGDFIANYLFVFIGEFTSQDFSNALAKALKKGESERYKSFTINQPLGHNPIPKPASNFDHSFLLKKLLLLNIIEENLYHTTPNNAGLAKRVDRKYQLTDLGKRIAFAIMSPSALLRKDLSGRP